ncbi:hypothetical protein TBR22_A42300 [Luteitalea sp. TBR-22]|nr:hypothetical protein TBR22_A42300 [Luteitalea sp. TBR-22]
MFLCSAASAQAASYTIFNSQAPWLASVQAMGPTTFGTGTFVGVGCAPGVACPGVTVNGLAGVGLTQNGPGSASFDGGLLNNLGPGGYLEWTFATGQNGWGGTFRMAPNNGLAIQVLDLPEGSESLGWVDATTVLAGQSLDGFLGLTSTERFGGVRVSALAPVPGAAQPATAVASSYRMTDVSIARAGSTAVPEPTSVTLLALSLVGLVVRRARA